ncbi:MAG: hypothetical protein FJX25_15615 [Alphaproteobacteria bacterium]|nr:hypothetical protein [Alphaproteobacteria bacterium]
MAAATGAAAATIALAATPAPVLAMVAAGAATLAAALTALRRGGSAEEVKAVKGTAPGAAVLPWIAEAMACSTAPADRLGLPEDGAARTAAAPGLAIGRLDRDIAPEDAVAAGAGGSARLTGRCSAAGL